MSNAMDEFKLIAEVRKRPAIWDINGEEHRTKVIFRTAWKEVAAAMGSDVNDCRRMWKSLRDRSRAIAKKIKLRIKEDKLNGSYNPNKDYSSQWPYFEHMESINGMKPGNSTVNDNKSDDNDSNQVSKVQNMDNIKMEPERDLEMSNDMDKFRLIAEVRKRPELWDFNGEEYRSKRILQTAWKDVAAAMGSNVTVNACRRTWKSLRSRNLQVVKKIELRIQEAKQKGTYIPSNDYGSEWAYLEHMKFMNDIKKPPVNENKSDLEIDKFKLISEIRKRPAIWDVNSEEHRTKQIYQTAWEDVAVAMESDVNNCTRLWKYLRDRSRMLVKKIELRIKEAKLKGSYNPNKDYGRQWPYLEHMDFINGMRLGNSTVNDNNSEDNNSNQDSKVHNMDNTNIEPEPDLEISNAMGKFKLIAEVRKRPALWDINSDEHRSKRIRQKAWKDLAVAMGSDVNDCKRIWTSLCSSNRLVVKKIEIRIKEAKLKGSYNPNKDYGRQWPYLEHMDFINGMRLGNSTVNDNNSDDNVSNQDSKVHNMDNTNIEPEPDLEISNAMGKFKLIAEVRKRPALWDINSDEHRSKRIHQKAWKDLAVAMGSDVNDCKRMWKSLWNSNRLVVKKIELRIQEAKLNGSYNHNNDYSSEWPYFEHMKFMNDIKKPSSMQLGRSNDIDNFKLIAEMRKRPALWDKQSEEHISCISLPEVWKDLAVSMGSDVETCKQIWYNLCRDYRARKKRQELRIEKEKLKGSYNPNNDYSSEWTYFEHMKFIDNIKNPSPMKLRNSTVNDNNSEDSDSNLFSNFHNMDNIKMEPELDLEPEVFVPDDDNDKPTTSNWKSTKRSYNQANVVDDLEKDDHKLIKSPRSDIKDSNDMVHVNDSDYNFLVSFLPQMEKINELQNLQFRTKITNLVLNIMSPSLINDTESVSKSQNVNSNN